MTRPDGFGAWDKPGDTRRTPCPECGDPGPHEITFVHGGNHAVSIACAKCGGGWTEEGSTGTAGRFGQAARMLAAIDAHQQANQRTKVGNGTAEDNEILRVIRDTLDDFNMEDVVYMSETGATWLTPADTDRLAEVIEQGIRQFGDDPKSIASHAIITLRSGA